MAQFTSLAADLWFLVQEIFLRELISNSSDALDKIKFESLKNKDKNLLESNPEFYIHIIPDKTNNTLTLIDSGIGKLVFKHLFRALLIHFASFCASNA